MKRKRASADGGGLGWRGWRGPCALAGLAWFLSPALAGCEANECRAASALVLAVDAYRRAPLRYAEQSAGALERTPCEPAATCNAKAVCLRSAYATREGMTLLGEVERGLRASDAAPQAGVVLTREQLDLKAVRAQAALLEGKNALTECDTEVLALRRRYNLPQRRF
jgi:hypothetical protein